MSLFKKFGENKKPAIAFGAILASVCTVLIFLGVFGLWYLGSIRSTPVEPEEILPTIKTDGALGEVKQFKSAEEFGAWLEIADTKSQYGGGLVGRFDMGGVMTDSLELGFLSESVPTAAPPINGDAAGSKAMGFGGGSAERISETNVQVTGIDEPDILKTDGRRIFYSPQARYYPLLRMVEPMFDEGAVSSEISAVAPEMISDKMIPPFYKEPTIKTVNAFPPEELALVGEIDRSGEMLLADNTLAVFTYDGVSAYDVSDPANPQETWKISYQNNNWPVAQRLLEGDLYLVLSGDINRGRPCPFVPITLGSSEVAVSCGDIWHPVLPASADVIYTVLKVDLVTGETKNQASFVGSSSGSTVYMSADNIYITHQYSPDVFNFMVGFLNENPDIVPNYVSERLNKVSGYDISDEAKMIELHGELGRWLGSLDEDESLRLNNEMENRTDAYFKKHRRELQSTGVVRLAAEDLAVKASGILPGILLNQFSLDEYNEYLRVATTIGSAGGWFWQFGFGTNTESVNDVYVLDMNLKQVGAALDMGLSERIYSVRFIGERGYVVTFRQTDPFYVLDLSKPTQPEIKGELKIPGYSSYLHPVHDNLILGIGQEGNQVKLSLFDVTDPTIPTEKSKYTLKEYWSDILNTHHAFLLDDKFKVFFLPGGEGGYVFSYEGDELKLIKAVRGSEVRRALFLDDYLYIVGDAGIIVLDEKDWSRVKELQFE
ncbi:beta-propeller domain-containing protein [Patescibacteria group bacterium]|nr:beta-propeller domain-containing protein [Patescibacteria group bacterium]MBU1029222.1 beta-propeller domain-containing protein [Patescibacteria group bacterium]MBU1916097.1 beta-propeller domain-containing protein [Patescibacteria group bacterium]